MGMKLEETTVDAMQIINKLDDNMQELMMQNLSLKALETVFSSEEVFDLYIDHVCKEWQQTVDDFNKTAAAGLDVIKGLRQLRQLFTEEIDKKYKEQQLLGMDYMLHSLMNDIKDSTKCQL